MAPREATADQMTLQERVAGFQTWLPREVELRIAVKRENDQWFALQMDFDITGSGASRAEAVQESFELLIAYLYAYYQDGEPFAAAARPIPSRLRTRIIVESALGRVLRIVALHLPLADESTYALPPGLLPQFAH